MNAEARQMLELISAGCPDCIEGLLLVAEHDPDAREAVRQLTQWLREDGQWRGELKRQSGWDGQKTAWAALEAFAIEHRTDSPWWFLLNYAEGRDSDDSAKRFFTL